MPAWSLNCPPRSNVNAANDNNNIHRFPAVVNRSAQHRPHRTRSSRHTPRNNGDCTADRNRPPRPSPACTHARPTQPLHARHSHRKTQRQVCKSSGAQNCFLIYCAEIGLARVLLRLGVERKCAAAVRRVRGERGGGRVARARGGREVRTTILKCGNFDKTSL